MKSLTLILAFALSASGGSALAASHEHEHGHQDSAAQQNATHGGTGVLKAVKPGKVSIAHEPIPSLDWPAMTMWFVLEQPLPDGITPGTAVRFDMMQGEKGQWKIIRIAPR